MRGPTLSQVTITCAEEERSTACPLGGWTAVAAEHEVYFLPFPHSWGAAPSTAPRVGTAMLAMLLCGLKTGRACNEQHMRFCATNMKLARRLPNQQHQVGPTVLAPAWPCRVQGFPLPLVTGHGQPLITGTVAHDW